MPKLDLTQVPHKTGSTYPRPYDQEVKGRTSLRLGDAGGLTQFGANIIRLDAGAKSSLRHYHMEQDELVLITKGTCTLVDDHGRHVMKVGDCATFPAGDKNGHHFINETDEIAEFLVIGTRTPTETVYYSDVDLMVRIDATGFEFTTQDGTPLEGSKK